MRLTSDADRYGAVARIIHWATATLVVALLVSALAMDAAEGAAGLLALRVHVASGASVLALTLLRVLWWALFDRLPRPPAGEPSGRRLAARAVHVLLYVLTLVVAGSGAATLVLAGALAVLLGSGELPRFDAIAPRALHEFAAWGLVGLAFVHAAAALYHLAVLRDGVSARMGLGAPAGRPGA